MECGNYTAYDRCRFNFTTNATDPDWALNITYQQTNALPILSSTL
jgi:hypothetical protein